MRGLIHFFIFILLTNCLLSYTFANQEHVVVAGETLYSLARLYQVSVDELQQFNNLSDPSMLKIGMSLKIPSLASSKSTWQPKTHVVEPGDTYYSIARKYELNVNALMAANQRNESVVLKIGETLTLPDSSMEQNSPQVSTPALSTPQPAATSIPTHWPSAGPGGRGNPTLPNEDAVVLNDDSKTEKAQPKNTSQPVVQSIAWPVDGRIAQHTGKQGGVTISSSQDATVRSVASGTVIYLGPYRELGNIVLIEKSGGYIYIYGGLDAVFVTLRQEITVGTALGMISSNNEGMVFSVFKDANPINPEVAPRD